jgi:putative nucleotidyltransferase with HDIG domain
MMNSGQGKKRKPVRRLRHLVSELPGRRVRFFGDFYRLVLLASAVILIDVAFPVRAPPELPDWNEEEVADQDVIAPMDFDVPMPDDELREAKEAAASSVSPILDHRPENADSAIANATEFFEALSAATEGVESSAERSQGIRAAMEERRIPVNEVRVSLLVQPEVRQRLVTALQRAFDRLLRPGVVREADLPGSSTAAVVLRAEGRDRLVQRDSLLTLQAFYVRARALAPAQFDLDEHRLYSYLIIRFASPSPTIEENREATRTLRDEARGAVDETRYRVLAGERIVTAHERVGSEEVEKLNALRAALAENGAPRSASAQAGGLLYNLILLLVFAVVLRYFRPAIYGSNRSLGLFWILVMAVIGAGALIAWSGAEPYLLPVAFAALVLASLYDGLIALVTVMVLVGLVAFRAPFLAVAVLFPTLLAGTAAALGGRVVRRRAHMWTFATAIAGAFVLAGASLGLLGRVDLDTIFTISFWGTVNAIGCALLAWGVLPLAETFTKITTDQTLLELADLTRPPLRKLSLEAPGTYAHSINVANVAEAAAHGIGANSLLVRVGSYYHDIGKVEKPQYFVENQPRGRNPHDKLKPSTSANIIREHVEYGLKLGQDARLPDQVRAFIAEHHGDARISFFWERAKELDPDGEYSQKDFRYPGPKPRSKETAVVMLADSVESAARVLQDPTYESIEELVDRIVRSKMDEKQLDDAPLTQQELTVIKQQFVKVLTGMYHSRIDYPTQNNDVPEEEEPAALEAP